MGPGRRRPRPRVEPTGGVTVSKKVDTLHEPLDLNRAAVEELQKLPGVGAEAGSANRRRASEAAVYIRR